MIRAEGPQVFRGVVFAIAVQVVHVGVRKATYYTGAGVLPVFAFALVVLEITIYAVSSGVQGLPAAICAESAGNPLCIEMLSVLSC